MRLRRPRRDTRNIVMVKLGPRSRHLVLPVALAVCASSCSFLFVTGPPPPEQRTTRFDCTTSTVMPTIDALVATLQLLSAVYAVASSDEEIQRRTGYPKEYVVLVGLSWGIIYT